MELPFHYIVRYNLIGYNNPNELKIHNYEISFSDSEPIVNRVNAFKAFDEFQSWVKDRIINKDGVSYIKSILPFKYDSDTNLYKNSEQSIEVILKVIRSIDGLYSLTNDNFDSELVIHKISSLSFRNESQDLMDNLLDEIKFYDHFNFDKGDQERIIRFYGYDFYDSGEDPDVLDNRILFTPFKWGDAAYKIEPNPIKPSNLISEIIKNGEGHNVEFKPSLVYNFKTNRYGYIAKYHAAKSIASFLNSDGGILLIGVKDNGEIQGLKFDYSLFPENPKDKFKLEFDNILYKFLKPSLKPYLETYFFEENNEEIFAIFVKKSQKPVFVRHEDDKEFFIRLETSSKKLDDIEEIIDYIFSSWNKDK